MPFDPDRHHRRSVRLRNLSYAEPGLYFVTICTHGRQRLFGDVGAGEMVLSEFGRIARDEWLRTPEVRPYVVLDAFVVMPDHVHLLFGILPHEGNAEASSPPPADGAGHTSGVSPRRFGNAVPHSVPSIMRMYKSVVTKRIRALDPTVRVWQARYHDRIVRTDREADALRRYIHENPMRWAAGEDRADGHRA